MADSVFCQLPWVSMAIRNNGDYRVCCHANTSPGRGLLQNAGQERLNAGTIGLDEARNSPTLRKIRQDMLEGRWPESCVRCQREEASGMRSKRIYSRDMLPPEFTEDWARAITESDGRLSLEQAPLVDMDVRFGNKCNLACRMCGPSDSSAWIDDHAKLGRRFDATGFDWHEKPAFWESLERQASRLEHIYIVGGEPLLIERHYQFLQHLIDIGRASKVTLEYNTNLTVLPQKALDLWARFAKVRIGVSFDGIKEVNDYIRHPSRFQIVERNLERLDQAPGDFQVWLACTISIYNLHHLTDLMTWVHSKNFRRIGKGTRKAFFVPHPVHQPEHLNIQSLPPDMKKTYEVLLSEQLRDFVRTPGLSEVEIARAREITDTYLKFMNARDLSWNWPEFLSYTKALDEIRRQDHKVLNAPFSVS